MNKLFFKVMKIIKILFVLVFFSLSFYICTLPEYASYNYFLRYFMSPFIWILSNIANLSTSVFLGYFVAIFVYFVIYGSIARNTLVAFTSMKDFLSEYYLINKNSTSVDDRFDKTMEFLNKKETHQLVKSTLSFVVLPFSVLAFKGITIDAFNYLNSNVNYNFLWFNLNDYDPYFLTSVILFILMIVLPTIFFIKNKMKTKGEQIYFYGFRMIVALVAIGTAFVNVKYALFLILVYLFSYPFNFIKKFKNDKKEPTIDNKSADVQLSQSQNWFTPKYHFLKLLKL